ncbi:hypothetical protein [Burkholderia sp. AU45388]|uniref:hypothetical protein n=1 Tax=Burkholderia sp. AU45388 TaxID=3059206 RepID=UPI00264D3CC7|nr:hypothetical protein [Burkholderia sp. AU45388]MDN7426120.1 hypothetical protein [Burkholderia sp. AU45388]
MSASQTGKRAIVPRFIDGRVIAALRYTTGGVPYQRLDAWRKLDGLMKPGSQAVLFSDARAHRHVFQLQAFYLRSARDTSRTLASFARRGRSATQTRLHWPIRERCFVAI